MIFSIFFTKEDPFVISMTFIPNIIAVLIFSFFMLNRTKSSRVERWLQWQQSTPTTQSLPYCHEVKDSELKLELFIAFVYCHCRIAVSNLHKETQKKFSDSISILYHMKNTVTGKGVPMISEKHYDIVMKNKDKVGAAVLYDGDFQYQYFVFKTL